MARSREGVRRDEGEPETAEQAALSGLVEQSRAGAKPVAQGTFRLDWTRALDKIKRFQLTDPHRYVLELVQAGVAAGAEQIEITTDADDLVLSFGGEAASAQELERIFDYLFTRDPALTRGRQLALGVNAALALRPRFVVVEAGDGASGARLEVRSHTDLRCTPTSAPDAVRGTRIHVKERRSWKVVTDALRGENAEDRILAEHCGFAPISVRLNGKDLRYAWRAPEPGVRPPGGDRPLAARAGALATATVREPIEAPDLRGEVALLPTADTAGVLHLCMNGVLVASEPQKELSGLGPLGFVAYVDSALFDRNASHTAVKHDEAYRKALRAVRQAARAALHIALRRLLVDGDATVAVSAADRLELLRQAARALLRARRGKAGALAPHLEALLDVDDLVALPFEDRAAGPLRPLWEAYRGEGRIRTVTRSFQVRAEDVLEPLGPVALGPLPLLRTIFHNKLVDVGAELAAIEAGLVNRRYREARRQSAVLAPGAVLVRVKVTREDPLVVGEVGLALPGAEAGAGGSVGVLVTFLREGVPLADVLVPDKQLRGRAVLDSPQYVPTSQWDSVERNAAFMATGKVLGGALIDLLVALQHDFPRPPPPRELLALSVWTAGAAEAPLDTWEGGAGWAADAAAACAREHLDALLLKLPRIARERAPSFYKWPIFFTLGGEARSLDQLIAAQGQVPYVVAQPWGAGSPETLNLSRNQRTLIRRYLSKARSGAKALRKVRRQLAEEAQQARARQENLDRAARRRQAPVLDPRSYLAIVDLPPDVGRGQAGIPRESNESWARILIDDLPLCDLPLSTPVPLQAVLQSPHLEADERFEAPRSGPALDALRAAVDAQCGPLAAALVRGGGARGTKGEAALWACLEGVANRSNKRAKHPPELPAEVLDHPLVPTVAHGLVSLRRLREDAAEHGRVRWIDFPCHEQRSERPIVVSQRQALLKRLVGARFTDFGAELRRELEVLERLRQPRCPAVIGETTVLREPVIGPGIRGELGLPADRPLDGRGDAVAFVQVLLDGLPLQLRRLNLHDLALVGVVDSARFTPGERYDCVVDDEAWRDAVRALRMAADRLVLRGCHTLAKLAEGAPDTRLLLEGERRMLCSNLQRVAGRRFCGRPQLELEGAPELDWGLASAPLWDSPAGQAVTLLQLAASLEQTGRVLVVGGVGGHLAPGRVIARAASATTRAALEAIFGSALADGSEILERDEIAYQRRQAAPVLRPALHATEVFAATPFEGSVGGHTVRGEVGVARAYSAAPPGLRLRLAVEGRQLCEMHADHRVAALAAVECAGLAVDEDWTALADPDEIAALEALVREALWRSLLGVADRFSATLPTSAEDRARCHALLDAVAAVCSGYGDRAAHDRLLALPLFATVSGRAMSGAALCAAADEQGGVLVVDEALPQGIPEDGRLVVRADKPALRTLGALLGDRVVRHDEAWQAELRGQVRRRGPVATPALRSDDAIVEISFADGGTTGLIGLRPPDGLAPADDAGDRPSTVRIHVHRRPVCAIGRPWHPTVEAWLNDDRLTPSPAFDDVERDAALDRALAVVEAQLPELVARAAELHHERWDDQPEDPLRLRLCVYAAQRCDALQRSAEEKPGGPAARLLAVPLWRARGGDPLCSTRAVLDAAARDALAWIAPEVPGDPDPGGPLLLVLGRVELRALSEHIGTPRDFRAALRRQVARRAFLELAQVPAVDLAGAHLRWGVISSRSLDPATGWVGEIGLRRGTLERLEAAVFHEGRLVTRILLGSPVEAVAAVQPPAVQLTEDYQGIVDDAAAAALRARLALETLETIAELAEKHAGLSPSVQAATRRVLLLALERLETAAKREPPPLDAALQARKEALVETLLDTPLIPDTRGAARSIRELRAAASGEQRIAVVTPKEALRATDTPRVVVCLDRADWKLLGALARIEDFVDTYERLVAGTERRRNAPTAARIDWGAVLVREPVSRGELSGTVGLAIPFGRGRLALFASGALVEEREPTLPGLVGELDGPLETDDYFERVLLSPRQETDLRALYRERLAAAVDRALELTRLGRAAATPEYLALRDYAAALLEGALKSRCPSSADCLRAIQDDAPTLDPVARRALGIALVERNDGRWITLRELLAPEEPCVVLCEGPVPEPEEQGEAAVFVRARPGPLPSLLGQLLAGNALLPQERWSARREGRRKAREARLRKQRQRAERRMYAELLSLLREALGAARTDERWPEGATLDQAAIARLTKAAAPKREDLLFRRSKQGPVQLNTASPIWRGAADAPPARRALLYLAAACTAELCRPDIHLAEPAEAALLLQELAALALRPAEGVHGAPGAGA